MKPSSQRRREEGLDIAQALGLAFAHLEAGRLTEARRLARALADRRPIPPGLDYLSGLLALSEGDGRKAAQFLSKACRATPEAVPPRLAFARSQTLQDRLDAAIAAYRLLLALAPGVPEAQAELGVCLQRDHRYAESLPAISQAVRSLSANAGLFNNQGIAWRAHSRYAEATSAFRAAIVLGPANAKSYANLASTLRQVNRYNDALAAALRATAIEPDSAVHWLELGQSRHAAKKSDSALAAYRRAITQTPADPKPIWLLAELLDDKRQEQVAIPWYCRILALLPDDPFGAGLALAHHGAAPVPKHAPEAHLRTLYDQYAGSFDANLTGDLAYRGPALLVDAIERVLGAGPFDTFDAGCGTGLSGEALRPIARSLTGADLSPRMLDFARKRTVYDQIHCGDLVSILIQQDAAYDLVAAVDVLIYQGDLTPVAKAAYAALRQGGAFAFTVEKANLDYELRSSTGRFAHSPDHIARVAAAAGFVLLLLEDVSTRREGGKPVPGLCCVLQKP